MILSPILSESVTNPDGDISERKIINSLSQFRFCKNFVTFQRPQHRCTNILYDIQFNQFLLCIIVQTLLKFNMENCSILINCNLSTFQIVYFEICYILYEKSQIEFLTISSPPALISILFIFQLEKTLSTRNILGYTTLCISSFSRNV